MATAYQGNEPYIFLSYSHKDEELALFVIENLQEHSFNVWYDEGIHSGTQWKDVITDKIASPNCWMMVFLVTKNSLASKECRREIVFADKMEKKFINVVIGSPQFPNWFICDFDGNQRLDEENFPNRKAMLDKLNSELIWHQINPDKSNDTPKDSPKDTQKEFPEGSPLPTAEAPEIAKVPKVPAPTQKRSEPSIAPKSTPAPSRTKGLRFTINGNTATVTGYTGTDSKVIIPATITRTGKTYNVTSIIAFAFAHCENLISVTIPNSVISIGDYAFNYCSNLTIYCEAKSKPEGWHTDWNPHNRPVVWGHGSSEQPIAPKASKEPRPSKGLKFTIADGTATVIGYKGTDTKVIIPSTITRKLKTYKVTSIGKSAFRDCTNLTSITIPDSVTSIGKSAFLSCRNLTSIAIPESVTSIGDYAFWDCTSLTSIAIPESVTSIGKYAFWECYSLTSITIPNSVTSIGNSAFVWCKNLVSITIPNSVTSIGESAFSGCSSLTSIEVDEDNQNYKSIDGNLYTKEGTTLIQYAAGKTATSFTIPNGVTTIGYEAFEDCKNLTSITIPDGVTSIGESAFEYCKNLTSITIPDSVTSIGAGAFYGCKNLTSITIPNSVTSIGKCAFYGCENLTSITIPNSVTTIGERAFVFCKNLTIYCEAKSKPYEWSSLWNSSNCTVIWGHKMN